MSLREHMREMHPRAPMRRSATDLASEHARQHHQYSPSHYHAGANLGPGQRPPGWSTGDDAIEKGSVPMSTPSTFRAESAAFEATIRGALRAEPGLSVDPDDDASDTAWVTWGPLDGNGYRINVGVLPGGVGREWGDEPHAFVSAAYLDGKRFERVICLVDVHANDLGDGAALTERLLNALRADRDRPRCDACKGFGSFPDPDGSHKECEHCGGPGFVGRREEFIDYRPDPYDADEDIDLDDEPREG